ncbi:MAG TPA: hypothetical protein VE871_04065 [Longimicrobium sp.]|nr:hypothetical protein [Longimicrobium sp.]
MDTTEQLEKRLAKLETSRKDVWDILQIIGALLIPVAIAWGSWQYSTRSSQAQIANAQQSHDSDLAVARIEARVRQAGLVATFMEALAGEDSVKRNLAIKAVLVALPEDGPDLVRVVSASSTNTEVAQVARSALDARRDELIRRLYGANREDRVAASADLVHGWGSRPGMIPPLLEHGLQNLQNADGLFNTIGVLKQVDAAALQPNRDAVEAFLVQAERSPVTGGAIKRLIGEVRGRLRGT